MPKNRKKRRATLDDGCSSELVKGAQFDGNFGIPFMLKPKRIIIPTRVLKFSERNQAKASYSEMLITYEYDIKLAELLIHPNELISDIKRFQGIFSPDCSLYWDMPLSMQILNIYRNRAIGYYFQKHGIYVIPDVRWGDERTYTPDLLGECVAFKGLRKRTIVSIGTIGCTQKVARRYHLKEGLRRMLAELKPKVVLVYGPMPDSIFDEFKAQTQFVHYNDVTTQAHQHGGHCDV